MARTKRGLDIHIQIEDYLLPHLCNNFDRNDICDACEEVILAKTKFLYCIAYIFRI